MVIFTLPRPTSNFIFFRKEADLELQGQFIQRVIYDDICTYNLVKAAASVLSKSNSSMTIYGYIDIHEFKTVLNLCAQVRKHVLWLFISCLCLETDSGKILELFGSFFFDFCQEAGYDVILRTLGSSVREFLEVCLF